MNNQEQSLDRIKLLMKYSVGNTLTENVNNVSLLKEDAMGMEMAIDRRNQEILGNNETSSSGGRKTLIKIPGMAGNERPITVVEGTVAVPFSSNDNSNTLFPGRKLIKDPKYGWYEVKNNIKVFYPTDAYWQNLASKGATKSFKTGPTVTTENGENYHFLMNLDEDGWPYATIGYKQNVDKPSRGWKLQPWYYKTDGDKQVPYDESNIDTRSDFDKFWDDYGPIVQLAGGLLIGLVTAGIGSVITASIIAEAGIVAAEGVAIASEVATVVNAVNTGRRYAFALEVLLEGGSNMAIAFYEKGRGEDPTLSFIFAALPIIKVSPGFNKIFGTLNVTQKECDDIIKAIEDFDGTNPHIFDALPKKSKLVFEEVAKAAKNNEDGFTKLFKDALEAQAKNAAKNKAVANTFIEKTVQLGKGTGKFIKHMAKEAGKDIALVGSLDLAYKGLDWAWQKLYAAYEDKYGQPMPKEEVKKVNNNVKKLPTEDEKIKYIEELAQSMSESEKSIDLVTSEPIKNTLSQIDQLNKEWAELDEFLYSQPSDTTNTKTQNNSGEVGNELGGSGGN